MYSTAIAYILWLVGGFGALGFHRFYLGKVGTGVLYLLTGGLFWVGALYDLFTLPHQVREANLRLRYREAFALGGVPGAMPVPPSNKEPLERVILRTAKKNKGRATASEVALEGSVTIEEAKRHLDKLVSQGFAEMRVSKSGTIVYLFNDFVSDPAEVDLEDF